MPPNGCASVKQPVPRLKGNCLNLGKLLVCYAFYSYNRPKNKGWRHISFIKVGKWPVESSKRPLVLRAADTQATPGQHGAR
jgi:hypothetical protein